MQVELTNVFPKRLLTPTGGYLAGYSHTLNPYTGCSFACSYCYVRQMPVALFRGREWGTWVDVKRNAALLLAKDLRREKKKGPVTIFMSSATDPYQPAEYTDQVTRSLLEVMADDPPDFLFVQTRSPLVTRDVELFRRFGDRLRVSVTVETDREDIRRAFTPYAPPIAARLKALQRLTNAGIPCQAAISPLLPCTPQFVEKLAATVSRVCVDDYFRGDGSEGRRTERLRIQAIYEQLGLTSWYSPEALLRMVEQLKPYFQEGEIRISQAGFMP